jgi:hypothetical protein
MPANDPHADGVAGENEPTPAEVVRSVLATARSLTLTTEGHSVDLVGLHCVTGTGGLLLHIPDESHLGDELSAAPGGGLAATVEFTDIAPVAVPSRVRARVALAGRLTAGADPGVLRFEPAIICLDRDGRSDDVGLDAFHLADPDPLAPTESELLTHLAGAHGDAVELLSQLVDARLLLGVTRVDPVRLDRYGIVLRLQRAGRRWRDVRLSFPSRPCNPAHGVVQLQTLLAQARTCPRRSRM